MDRRKDILKRVSSPRYAAGCLAVCVCLLLTACQKGDSDGIGSDASDDNRRAEESGVSAGDTDIVDAVPEKEWAYVPEFIAVEDNRASYGDMQLVRDTVCYISMVSEAEGEPQKICRYSLTDRELTQISIQWTLEEKNLEICSFVFTPDCSVWLIVNAYSADYSQLRRFLCRFDADGKNLLSQEITEEMGRGSCIGDMAVDGEGRIYVFTSEYAEAGDAGIWLYTDGGSYQGMLRFDTSEIVLVRGTVNGEDGKLYTCIGKGEDPESCTLLEVDFEGKKLTEIDGDFPNIKGLCVGKAAGGSTTGGTEGTAGAGQASVSQEKNSAEPNSSDDPGREYDLLLYDDKYVYGYDLHLDGRGSGQAPEELFLWTDSDINGYFVESISLLEDGRIYAAVEDWTNEDRTLALLRRTKAEDVTPRKNMVLAAVDGGSSLTALTVKFNRSQAQYHLELKNYDSLTDLYNAILTKEAMDIIDLSGVNVESLLRQGVFEDLRPYLEQSESLAPSDFVEGILDTYTVGGKLIGIPDSFMLKTIAGDRTLLGDGGGLTLEGLLEIARRNPGALPVGDVTKNEMMQYLMMFVQDTFIDWEKGECRFDSLQFQAVLEFVNRFPDSLESLPGEDSLPRKIHDGRVLFAIADIWSLGNFQRYEGMFGETAACVGFPTEDGRGGTLLYPRNAFGITSMSQYKEGGWKFIESVLDPGEAEQMEPKELVNSIRWQLGGLPSLKKIMDIMIEYYLEEDRIWAEKGRNFGFLTYDDGWIIEFHALTREEVDIVLDLVKEAKPYFSAEDDDIIKIINEEAPAFYSGQKSPEDTAKIIQNRVQLYVDENR